MAKAVPVMGLGRLQPSHTCVIKAGFYPQMSVRDDAKIGPVRNKSCQACQEPSPCLLALTLNNGKHEWINLVVSIRCHCYQQLPLILAIEVRSSMLITGLQCLNPSIHRPKAQKAQLNVQVLGTPQWSHFNCVTMVGSTSFNAARNQGNYAYDSSKSP